MKPGVLDAITAERYHQGRKWGNKPHEVGAWLLIIEGELNEAKQAWLKNSSDYDALLELVQVAATVVACLEQHGAPWSTARWRIKIE